MRTLYFSIAGCLALVAAGFAGWKYRNEIKGAFNTNLPKAKDAVRSTYGRVSKAADNMLHTERPIASA